MIEVRIGKRRDWVERNIKRKSLDVESLIEERNSISQDKYGTKHEQALNILDLTMVKSCSSRRDAKSYRHASSLLGIKRRLPSLPSSAPA